MTGCFHRLSSIAAANKNVDCLSYMSSKAYADSLFATRYIVTSLLWTAWEPNQIEFDQAVRFLKR